jgi:hypothetical protein
MDDGRKVWHGVRGWFHYPALKDPRFGNAKGGAHYDFRKNETLVDEGFIRKVNETSGLPVDKCLEGIYAHEIGHYMVFPKNLSTLILAAYMIENMFTKEKEDVHQFILQTYADMANDTSAVLEEQRTGAILDMRTATQTTHDDECNGNIRAVMLKFLHHTAKRPYELKEELHPYFEKMKEVDFLNVDHEKMRQGLFAFGNIIIDLIKKYPPKGGNGPGDASDVLGLPNDTDIKDALKNASPGEIKEAMRQISHKLTKGECERLRKWLKDKGKEAPKTPLPGGMRSIGTSEGELTIDPDVISYYYELSKMYPILTTKKLLDTEGKARSWSDTEKWRPGTDKDLALPGSSGGLLLPGITRKVRITERPIQTTDYKVPHLLEILDSSGSMPDPKQSKSFAVLGGFCVARSYHLHGGHVGVINFSGSSFYLPYTRELFQALGAISAYQGGGTVADVEMIRKMLGPEAAKLYSENIDGRIVPRGIDRMRSGLPHECMKKEVSINLQHIQNAFAAKSIDVVLFTDGGIANLNEVLQLFEEKAEINRATIVLTHGFTQELDGYSGKIAIYRIDDVKDIPGLVIKESRKAFNAISNKTAFGEE